MRTQFPERPSLLPTVLFLNLRAFGTLQPLSAFLDPLLAFLALGILEPRLVFLALDILEALLAFLALGILEFRVVGAACSEGPRGSCREAAPYAYPDQHMS